MGRLRPPALLALAAALSASFVICAPARAAAPPDPRLDWWREARFGLFVHWGLYAVPAGEWEGKTDFGEWIRSSAQIPLAEYDRFCAGFTAPDFDPDRWARLARQAGMGYLVITTKHHDGFCLFASAETDFDVLATPCGRDVLRELVQACRREGIRIGWYHSIMDWHHPDYLPRRDWETDRPVEGADFTRYVAYLKAQLRELLTGYGPIDVLWFDGQWEGPWTDDLGRELYLYVRSLQPDIIINNRGGRGGGDFGLDAAQGPVGDFGTPEQHVPPQGLPGVDGETSLTMNRHWGYSRADHDYKSAAELIRTLVDVASKGGNLLLNVGPDAEGRFPPETVERLEAIGRWMDTNGEAIRGTTASALPAQAWGRVTQKTAPDGSSTLYLHLFRRPAHGTLTVNGLMSEPDAAYLLAAAAPRRSLLAACSDQALVVQLPDAPFDTVATVVALRYRTAPDIAVPPAIAAAAPIFVGTLDVAVSSPQADVELRYTLDGTPPTRESALADAVVPLRDTATVTVRAFRAGRPVSPPATATFTRVVPRPAVPVAATAPGLRCECREGEFEVLPDFDAAPAAVTRAVTAAFEPDARPREDRFACRFRGYVRVPTDGVYRFFLRSDDGSRLWLGDTLVIDNDGLHSSHEEAGWVALAAGLHPLTVAVFERTGGFELDVGWEGPGLSRRRLGAGDLVHAER